MPDDPYGQLLDATVRHLEDLRRHGVKYVSVEPQSLAALASSGPPRASASRRSDSAPVRRASGTPASTASRPPLRQPVASPVAATPPRAPAGPASAAVQPVQAGLPVGQRRGALSPAEKAGAMGALLQRAQACRKCSHLASSRRNVVFGVGDIHSPLMFVGKAGQLLTRIIQTMGLGRDRVYIANILKCRPDTPGQASGNRKPTPSEMATCIPYLLEQVDIIQPKVIVALGATAVEGLFGKTEGITRARGKWLQFRDTPVMPTYHPAYLLRNQAITEKRKVWEDMLAVLERLGMPISEKQRGYFLSA